MFLIFFQDTWTTDASLQHYLSKRSVTSDSFIVVTCYPDHGRLFDFLLTNTIRHMEYWSSAIENVNNPDLSQVQIP
jgi:hypothetical protein